MRDRLKELFEEMDKNPEITCPKPNDVEACKSCKYKIGDWLCNTLERKVDYLLANGVIVPPCKVGDKVYTVGVFTGQVLSHKVVAINYGDEGLYLLLDGFTVVSVTEQLGKTVFLTKEEAEAKLKELKK